MSRPNYNTRFSTVDRIAEYRGTIFKGEWPTIPELIKISALKYPDNKCLETFTPEHFSMTYSQFYDTIRQIAHKIRSLGFKKGDNIAVSGKNSPEWALAYFGIIFSGCTVTPLDALLQDNEVANLVRFAEVKLGFVDSSKGSVFKSAGVENLVFLDKEIVQDDVSYILDWCCDEAFVDDISEISSLDDVAEILFTSGTTGSPKGVMLTHKNIVCDIFYAQNNMKIYPTDVFYLILPIHHAYALMAAILVPLNAGANIIFGKRIVVNEMLRDLKVGKVTLFLGVPALFNKLITGLMNGVRKKGRFKYAIVRAMMRYSGFIRKTFGANPGKKMFRFLTKNIGFDNMRICISGAGALPESTCTQFRNLGVQFVEGYGMTETSPISSLNPIEGYKFGSVGKIFPELQFKFKDVDSQGNGVLCLKGDVVMKGYYKNPEATLEVIDEDGFLNTGDVGYVDKDNYFYITGRAKNIIVTDGGKNVFPEEIEDKFQLYDDIVEQVVVAPYKSEQGDEKIRAIVYPSKAVRESSGGKIDKIMTAVKEVVAKVNKKLQSYKKISKVQISKEPLEMTTTNKPKRKDIIKRMDSEKGNNNVENCN